MTLKLEHKYFPRQNIFLISVFSDYFLLYLTEA
jgi:hypothetical protein